MPMPCEDCPHIDRCSDRFSVIEERIHEVDSRWSGIQSEIGLLREKVGSLEGRIAGYLIAASLVGTAVAFIAAKVLGHQG